MQSYVRGRIAQYLDTSAEVGDQELEQLRDDVATKTKAVEELAESLDVETVRSRTTSLLRNVSRQMTAWAQGLDLEHAEDGVQIDLDRLTIVADTPGAPAYLDRGEIGSGMNWVGYHLTAYLALQRFSSSSGGRSRPSSFWISQAGRSSPATVRPVGTSMS